jgi:hypothetical protein
MRSDAKFGQKFQAIFMFILGCLTSPCCTPLFVPLGLTLLVGTPSAVWLGGHLGWVYGALTLVSIASFVITFRSFQAFRDHKALQPGNLPAQKALIDHDRVS